MNKEIVVSVCCITYNHENYIREAIEGFLIQKTNFPFEILIHDDASTDKTTEIVREYEKRYPQLIRGIYQCQNQFSKGIKISPTFVWPKANGKYIALCEGDDYWTDPYKLQKQVDFLEANPEYVICFHPVKVLEVSKNKLTDDFITRKVKETTGFFELAKGNYIHTPSVLFVRKYIENFDFNSLIVPIGDIFIYHNLVKYGKIKKLNSCMAVYRKHDEGAWSGSSKMLQAQNNIATFKAIKVIIPFYKRIWINRTLSKFYHTLFKEYKYNNRSLFQILSAYLFFSFYCLISLNLFYFIKKNIKLLLKYK